MDRDLRHRPAGLLCTSVRVGVGGAAVPLAREPVGTVAQYMNAVPAVSIRMATHLRMRISCS